MIIPTYNRAHTILKAVGSVTAQTYPHLEVLVVDDASTDHTASVVAKAAAADSRIRYLPQAHTGVAGARNHGLSQAHGEFIAFLDSDDCWYPWKIQLQLECLAALPDFVGMIWTDMDAYDVQGKMVQSSYLRHMYAAYGAFPTTQSLFPEGQRIGVPPRDAGPSPEAVFVGWGNIYRPMLTGNLVHTSTVLLRRSRLQVVGDFDVDLHHSGEDFDFHLRTCRAGPVAYADICSVAYQIGAADQLTATRYGRYMARNFVRTIEKAIEYDGSRFPLPERVRNRVLSRGYAWYGTELLPSDRRQARHVLRRSLRLNPMNGGAIKGMLRAASPLPPETLARIMEKARYAMHAAAAFFWPF